MNFIITSIMTLFRLENFTSSASSLIRTGFAKNLSRVLFILVLFVSFAAAGKGSLYSRYGIGEINTFLSGKNNGMGNTGIALFGDTHINLMNPAGTSMISKTMLSVSYQYNNYTLEDATGSTVFGTGNINSLALAMPVFERKKMVLTLGLLPYSLVDYEQHIIGSVGGQQLVQSFEGRGGISSGQLGLSYALQSDIHLGLTTHYFFGSIYRDQTITFLTGSLFGGSFHHTSSVSGFGLTLGGIYSGIDKALGFSETKNMNVGMTLFSGSSLSYDEQTLRNFPTNQDTIEVSNKSVTLPMGLTLGASYVHNNIAYAADFHFNNMDNLTIGGVHPKEISNSFRLGAGVEFLPVSDFIGDEFWKRSSYRMGGYVNATGLTLNGESINEYFVTGGFTVPMSNESKMHLGLEYGIRGTTASSLIKDSILRFTVAVSASEMMFIQPPIE